MPVLLTYAINTIPNPLTANTLDGILELIATNVTGVPVTIIGINIGIPVGKETDGNVLTSLPAQIVPTPPTAWTMGDHKESPGLYTFRFTPPNNSPVTIPAGGSLVFVLTKIAVNVSGTATVKVTEGTELPLPIPVSKFPAGWGDVNFTAESSNAPNGVYVTLGWDGPAGAGPAKAVYTIQYLDPATQQPVIIPAAGDPPLANSGTYPPLNISAITVFTLWVKATIFGHTYTTEAQQTVVSGRFLQFPGFNGTMTGRGDSLQLNLTWRTTNADSVMGSWTSNLQAPNPITPAIIYPPFNQIYSITAINSALPSAPAYLYLSWIVYPQTIAVGNGPTAIAITSDGQFAFVANSNGGTVSVIDVNNLAAPPQTIAVGNGPTAIAITPDNQFAFVANGSDSGSLSVIQINTLKVTKTIPVGNNPSAIAVTPDNNYALVVNPSVGGFMGTVSLININSLAVTQTIPVGNAPSSIAITPDSTFAFVTNCSDYTVSAIDMKSLAVTQTINVGTKPTVIAITPDGNYVLVVNSEDSNVSVIDVNDLAAPPQTIFGGYEAQGMVITPDSRYAFVPDVQNQAVSVIDIKNLSAAPRIIIVGNTPQRIAITTDGGYVFVANTDDSTVSVIDVKTLTVTQTITVGNNPSAIAFTPDGKYAFVGNSQDNTVSVLGWGLPAE